MDIDRTTLAAGIPLASVPDDYAIDYPFTVAANNSSSFDFVQVK